MIVRRIRIKIKENLAAKGMTQSELAKLIGVREATISDMSRGKYNSVKLNILCDLLFAFQLETFDDLLEIVYVNEETEQKQERQEGEGVLV